MRTKTATLTAGFAILAALVPGAAWGANGAEVTKAAGPLTSYANPYGNGTANTTDGGTARVHAVANSSGDAGKTIVTLHVSGLAPNREYGSHVHVLACDNNKAGPHYRNVVANPASPENEIWLDFTTNAAGNGSAQAVVDWTIRPDGANAVIIHDRHSDHLGVAGPKLACINVAF
ncbi:MAG: hypothetical protein ABIM89_06845 [Mycobacteriales bacterium]